MASVDERTRKKTLGQYFTSTTVAGQMASLFSKPQPAEIRLLDAGAGAGALSRAFVKEMCERDTKPCSIHVTAFEKDESVISELASTLDECRGSCRKAAIDFEYEIRHEDFISSAVDQLKNRLFDSDHWSYNAAIVNPPYRKISSDSRERNLLRSVGIETSNLYTAFISLVVRLLNRGSELVAITPRSFCNGAYFRSFRRDLLSSATLRQVHVFDSRTSAFRHDDVLQENIIFHVVKERPAFTPVLLSSSADASLKRVTTTDVPYSSVVRVDDPNQFIHLTLQNGESRYRSLISGLTTTLADLGLAVSTGRVVDFRAKEYLRAESGADTVPLIYACHFEGARIVWPKTNSRKPNAIVKSSATQDLLVPCDYYVLTKRFSPKEEPRRVVACVYDPSTCAQDAVGFDNKLNYFHANGKGLPFSMAKGLFAFLNSSALDDYFREFSGHTQINATDLRSLRYPSREQLESIGEKIQCWDLCQDEIDHLVEDALSGGEK